MGMLTPEHRLRWEMKLAEGGHVVWELLDGHHRRWGWTLALGEDAWMSHTGGWGQASHVGLPAPPVPEAIEHHPSAAAARSWIEDAVAVAWAAHHGAATVRSVR